MTNRHALLANPSRLIGLAAVPLALVLTACGGAITPGAGGPATAPPTQVTTDPSGPHPAASDPAPIDAPVDPTVAAPTTGADPVDAPDRPTDSPTGGGAIDFDGVQSATIQLIANGTFADPSYGNYETIGAGSGFLIDSSGLAVTNNHVVVGAGTVTVYRGGDTTEKINAKVLGSSECLDLAVVQLTGDDYPYMEWYEGDIATATDVYAAGFPLGDPVFTMTRGIVSKASTPGETDWASVDSVIEHDARIRGGNSGGPLVDAEGKVVGVNYAGRDDKDYNYAIHRDEALAVLPELIAGQDVLSLGINAVALTDDEGQGLGIWVSSVKSGSPADKAGVEPGDLLTRMEGVAMGADGTLSAYCDVLRTHGTDAALAIEVLRPTEGAYYRGQVNSDEVLAPVTVLGTEEGGYGNEGGSSGGEGEPAVPAGDFVDVTDDSGAVRVTIPSTWGEVDGSAYVDEFGNEFVGIEASTDLAGYRAGWDTAGVTVRASQEAVGVIDPAELINSMSPDFEAEGCVMEAADDYADGYHTGVFGFWSGCGGVGAATIVVAATSDDGQYMILVAIQATTEEDLASVDRILGSFAADFGA